MADYRTVKADSLTSVVRSIVKAGGSSDREADLVATNLVEANLKGHDSHGVGMVPRAAGWLPSSAPPLPSWLS